MISEFVPEEDEHLENYLLMPQITDYLLAPEIIIDEVAHLRILIETHHTAFVDLYPDASVLPKMHYLPVLLAVYVVGTNRILLHTKILQIQQLAHHYRGYIMEHSSSEHKMFYLDDLYNPFPLHLRRLQCDGSTKLLVVTKHHICKAL